MGAFLRIEGDMDIEKKIKEIGDRYDSVEENVLLAGGNVAKKSMKNEVPVSDIDHKHIRDDIEVFDVEVIGGKRQVAIAPGKETNWRAKFIERGTSKQPPNPFMTRAMEKAKGDIREAMRQELLKGLGL
ncbi:HK97-gp10 family putative phage morphogenesis protein [Bacillus subtilis]|uniref:HK97-gp10 family putative phage morphogenesis protein n=1 Tax=Bacillus subtilis TaxID=1423 RepID=UPI000A35184C|nr:HK97-gp10 family putative phage morphogenesis protein [Bacillus subtilis]OTQ85417.1 hypothetical protein BG31_14915 [Bacillus subtilis subsp. subtilis]WBY39814.1 HK97 gp10 family phage protein [Bacillus subtilis]